MITATSTAAAWPAGTPPWLDAAARRIRATMLTGGRYDRRSCVNASAIGADVLRYFGVQTRGQAVRVLAITPDALAWNLTHGWGRVAPIGHSVGIGYSGLAGQATAPGDWDGHLVLHAPMVDGLLDLAIDQADRGERLPIPGPVVAGGLDPAWPGNGEELTVTLPGGRTVLRYEVMTGAAVWRQFSGWRNVSDVRRAVVGEAIRAVREVTT